MKDYYKILNVGHNASSDDLRANFRLLVKKWRPDINKSPRAHDMIIEINEAYEILSNPSKRRVYDNVRQPLFETRVSTQNRNAEVEHIQTWANEAKVKANSIINQV